MLEKDGPLICIKKPKRGHGREPGRLLRSQQREQWAQHVETRDAAVLGGTEMEARAAGVAYNRLFIVAWTPPWESLFSTNQVLRAQQGEEHRHTR